MDELAQARAELDRLERRERELRKQLCSIRKFIKVQKSLIESLVRRVPAPIKRLPVEILLWILDFTLQVDDSSLDVHHQRKRELAVVSRHWRDVIFNCPAFWTRIRITPSWSASLVKEYVERSGKCLLDIDIRNWDRWTSFSDLRFSLSLVIASAHRWRNIDIRENSEFCSEYVFDMLSASTFPSLIHAAIICEHRIIYPQFLRPENSPALKHVEIKNLDHRTDDDIPIGSRVVDFSLQSWSGAESLNLCLLQQLTTLSLSTDASYQSLDTDSAIFPFLTSLVVKVSKLNLTRLMTAIVAPRLAHFCYLSGASIPHERTTAISNGFGSKFKNVRRVAFRVQDLNSIGADMYSAFPNVCTAEIHIDGFAGTTDNVSRAVDHWARLQDLSLFAPTMTLVHIANDLALRLHRQQPGRAMLHLKLSRAHTTIPFENTSSENQNIFTLFNSLHEYCVLELLNFPLTFRMKSVPKSDDPLTQSASPSTYHPLSSEPVEPDLDHSDSPDIWRTYADKSCSGLSGETLVTGHNNH
ncbi:hypothetical protein SCLCIDRAFT_1223499 [Scleroderma citrinum Foug A]|uniref:Uncharacterized protein n=1 Tax=Scleroderma citrinum Foug A TaxID=1036808 RepID=A0A0C2ZJ15_9AGAM|nr:hypothetical protein SCLCIDRAFT_1223499 [Scleroderma citrinum Foug A]